MTVRSVILGLVAAAAIAGVGFLSDGCLQNTFFVGNHMPFSVFGLLILTVMLVNPLLGLLSSRLAFRASELAVILAMSLAACSIPGSGLMRTFTSTLVIPMDYQRQKPDWQRDNILGYVPAAMLPAEGKDDPQVIDGFLNGLRGADGKPVGMEGLPWRQWATPLAVWAPLLLLLAFGGICLTLIVHPQWSRREHLSYPIAAVATSLIAGRIGADKRSLWRSKLFWGALLVVLAIRGMDGYRQWHPGAIFMNLHINLWAIRQKWPDINTYLGFRGNWLVWAIYPSVVAIGFLLTSEVSLSLGVAPLLMMVATGLELAWGVDVSGDHVIGGVRNWQRFGSYLGLMLLIAYTGRRYYWQVLKQAVSFRAQSEADSTAVWACRMLLVSIAGMVVILVRLGLDWPLALLVVLLIHLMFLVMARISAETGLFFCQPWWQPMGVFMGLFGVAALGPAVVATLAVFCAVTTIDPRECLMPFMINALKTCGDAGVARARVGWATAGAFLLALAVVMPVAIWANYNYGMFQWDRWATDMVPKMTFGVVERTVHELDATYELEEAGERTTWGRLAAMRPEGDFLKAAGAGVLLVLVFSALRLRYAKFPLHPVIFLVWGTYPIQCFSQSFLMGWMIKWAVMKYGGTKAYRATLPLMFGAVAGDVLAGLIFLGAGAVYYLLTGFTPPAVRFFPG